MSAESKSDWQDEIDQLRHRERLAYRMGPDDKIARQRAAGRLTIRERIDAVLDQDSFREVGAIAGSAAYNDDGVLDDFRASNCIFGRGKIDSRPVVVCGDDFTIRGGAADASIHAKQVAAEQLANEYRMPLVRLVEGTGGGGSVKTLERDGYTYVPANPGWDWVVSNMATVPVVGLALGPVAGLGAARVVNSHYAVMVKGLAQIFVAGPPVVARLGERVDKEQLGGSDIHGRNGVVDDVVATEEEAFQRARAFLSFMPRSIDELPARSEPTDDPERADDWLLNAIPKNRRKVYKIRPIIESIVDQGSFMEIGKTYGRSVVTGFARLDGWPVAILAPDPYIFAGGWTADASQKITRFVDLAQTFHFPVVHLVDCPGFVIGTAHEKAATIRHGSRALAAVYQATVPWCSVILRKSFGVAGAGHSNHTRYQYRFAWPSGDWGSLPLEGGIEAAYKSDLAVAEDPEAELIAIEKKLNQIRSPFRTAERFGVEDLIDPRETRSRLCEFANLSADLRRPGPSSFSLRP